MLMWRYRLCILYWGICRPCEHILVLCKGILYLTREQDFVLMFITYRSLSSGIWSCDSTAYGLLQLADVQPGDIVLDLMYVTYSLLFCASISCV